MDEQQDGAAAGGPVGDLVAVQADALVLDDGRRRHHAICTPEIARAMTSRWISEVPSKIV